MFFFFECTRVSRNENRQLICSVLKLLLSHSGHHGLVVSYWFSESPITFPHNGCHYLFNISLQLGFHLFLNPAHRPQCLPRGCSTFNSQCCHDFHFFFLLDFNNIEMMALPLFWVHLHQPKLNIWMIFKYTPYLFAQFYSKAAAQVWYWRSPIVSVHLYAAI